MSVGTLGNAFYLNENCILLHIAGTASHLGIKLHYSEVLPPGGVVHCLLFRLLRCPILLYTLTGIAMHRFIVVNLTSQTRMQGIPFLDCVSIILLLSQARYAPLPHSKSANHAIKSDLLLVGPSCPCPEFRSEFVFNQGILFTNSVPKSAKHSQNISKSFCLTSEIILGSREKFITTCKCL